MNSILACPEGGEIPSPCVCGKWGLQWRSCLYFCTRRGVGGFTHLSTSLKLLWEEAGWISKAPRCCPLWLYSLHFRRHPDLHGAVKSSVSFLEKSPLSQESSVTRHNNAQPPQGRTRLLKEHKEEDVTSECKELTQPGGKRDQGRLQPARSAVLLYHHRDPKCR